MKSIHTTWHHWYVYLPYDRLPKYMLWKIYIAGYVASVLFFSLFAAFIPFLPIWIMLILVPLLPLGLAQEDVADLIWAYRNQ
jgi:hypothetical protein